MSADAIPLHVQAADALRIATREVNRARELVRQLADLDAAWERESEELRAQGVGLMLRASRIRQGSPR